MYVGSFIFCPEMSDFPHALHKGAWISVQVPVPFSGSGGRSEALWYVGHTYCFVGFG